MISYMISVLYDIIGIIYDIITLPPYAISYVSDTIEKITQFRV